MSVLGELAFLVNDDFEKPLNQQIKDMIGVVADDTQIYTQQNLGSTTGKEQIQKSTSLIINSKKNLIVDTQGSVTIQVDSTHKIQFNDKLASTDDNARVYYTYSVYHNDNKIYTSGENLFETYYSSATSGTISTKSFSSGQISIPYIKKGDRIFATIEFRYSLEYRSALIHWLESNFNINVYAKTVIIEPNLFKVE